jgi:hypothetical protein
MSMDFNHFAPPLEQTDAKASNLRGGIEPALYTVGGQEFSRYKSSAPIPSDFPHSPLNADDATSPMTAQEVSSRGARLTPNEWSPEDEQRAHRVHNEWQINGEAADYFEGHHPASASDFRVRDAWMEILMSNYCAGDPQATPEQLAKDWQILEKAGISREDINAMLDQAEAAGVPGRTICRTA